MMKRIFLFFIVVSCAILLCNCASIRTQSKYKDNTDQIIGVWKLVPPVSSSIEGKKIYTKEHFIVFLVMPDKNISASHGGTYSFDGETLIENIEFSTPNRAPLIGLKPDLKVRFEGNRLYAQLGTNIEIWERIE